MNINISTLPAGAYILQVKHGGNSKQYKAIKK
ncbi:T9SS type A sorting domain-containing protein [Chitinophaga sp. 22321]|uniref:T9SS type A sorting domain-containing protein n=1 Tax=Chitinophaga hostae TaxID=2831022 RepID=A0ABS5IZA5_9BACT|nr:T9SS type A sorting domain-containing protein [Chitinophaga hostae]MBS0028183.1 T9SS type A sorting domain-containing protein [Chitinophaga hostae]